MAVALGLVTLSLAASTGPPECARFSVHELVPGMRAPDVRRKMASARAATEVVAGAAGPASVVTYQEVGSTVRVRYDRDASRTSDARVVSVKACSRAELADPMAFARRLLDALGEPAQGRDSLDAGLRSGRATWVDAGCSIELSAFREDAEWWRPEEGGLCVEVQSRPGSDAAPRPEPVVQIRPPRNEESLVPPPRPPESGAREPAASPPRIAGESHDALPARAAGAEGDTTVAVEGAATGAEASPNGSAGEGGDRTEPARIANLCAAPRYPASARATRLDARVMLRAVVRGDGTVGDVTVLRATRPGIGFEEAAVEAVKKWRYEAATRGGIPVDASVEFWIDFKHK